MSGGSAAAASSSFTHRSPAAPCCSPMAQTCSRSRSVSATLNVCAVSDSSPSSSLRISITFVTMPSSKLQELWMAPARKAASGSPRTASCSSSSADAACTFCALMRRSNDVDSSRSRSAASATCCSLTSRMMPYRFSPCARAQRRARCEGARAQNARRSSRSPPRPRSCRLSVAGGTKWPPTWRAQAAFASRTPERAPGRRGERRRPAAARALRILRVSHRARAFT